MEELKLLLESCRSEETKKTYAFGLQKYFKFVGGEHKLPKGTKNIENKIIEYIIYLKKEGMSYQGISNYVVPVKSYYAINDVTLNVKKIAKFMPENRKVKTDRSYEHEELLEFEAPLIAINPKFDKLITSLRTAISDDLGKLDKEQTSYHNVLDAFRLALKGIKIVKKEKEIEYDQVLRANGHH
jgi:hypothetical protein